MKYTFFKTLLASIFFGVLIISVAYAQKTFAARLAPSSATMPTNEPLLPMPQNTQPNLSRNVEGDAENMTPQDLSADETSENNTAPTPKVELTPSESTNQNTTPQDSSTQKQKKYILFILGLTFVVVLVMVIIKRIKENP